MKLSGIQSLESLPVGISKRRFVYGRNAGVLEHSYKHFIFFWALAGMSDTSERPQKRPCPFEG